MTNYYKILGVKDFASKEDIKTAYRKLSKKFHPDVNDGDEFFAEKFKEIQEAYEHLTDESKKRKYDNQLNNSFGNSNENYSASKSNKQPDDSYNPFKTEKGSKKNDSNVKTSKKSIIIICLILIATFFLVYLSNRLKDHEINNSTPIDNTANETDKIAEPYSDINSKKIETVVSGDINESSNMYYNIGSSKNAVLKIQGTPTAMMKAGSTEYWHYGSSSVTFENGRVNEFSNIGENLKIKLIDEGNKTLDAASVFTIGSSKNTVLQIQGNPTAIMNAGSTEYWHYGPSNVTFENGKVSEFSNIGQNLKIKL